MKRRIQVWLTITLCLICIISHAMHVENGVFVATIDNTIAAISCFITGLTLASLPPFGPRLDCSAPTHKLHANTEGDPSHTVRAWHS
eukprot:1023760-Amphidinium_carterae.1